MNIIDSSGWLEYFLDTENADNFVSAIYNKPGLLVSSISVYEVHRFLSRNPEVSQLSEAMKLMHQGTVAEINSDIAIAASEYAVKYKLAMADALIYATARVYNATLWTQDIDHKDLPDVKYFPKVAG